MLEQLSPSYWWLIIGIACLAVEAIGVSGVGFFFAGLAALCLGVMVEVGVLEETSYIAQCAWFFGLTTFWAAVLWKPLKEWHLKRKSKNVEYSNIVGDSATVSEGGIAKGTSGNVVWSGTIMKAELSAESEQDSLPEGATVTVKQVKGATLVVDAA